MFCFLFELIAFHVLFLVLSFFRFLLTCFVPAFVHPKTLVALHSIHLVVILFYLAFPTFCLFHLFSMRRNDVILILFAVSLIHLPVHCISCLIVCFQASIFYLSTIKYLSTFSQACSLRLLACSFLPPLAANGYQPSSLLPSA